MKGLLIKDFRIILKIGKSVFIILGLFMVLATGTMIFSKGENNLLNAFFGAITGVVSVVPCALIMGTLTLDESSHWNEFALGMPIKNKEIVLSKYVMTILISLVAAIIIGVFITLAVLSGGIEFETTLIYVVIGAVLASLLFCSTFFPIAYKFGANRGRIIFAMLCVLPTVFIFFKNLFPDFSMNQEVLFTLLKLSPIFIIMIFIGSFFLSCKIFSKKPF